MERGKEDAERGKEDTERKAERGRKSEGERE